tara:strand:- start:364 stop:1341 length:978 start_codon:yes stop_codon:yes gene_type:complete
MATSGSVDFSITRDNIITEALQLIGVIGEGETPSDNQKSDCSRSLNMMIKFWMADGMNLFVNQEIVIFPIKGQRQYTFGGSSADKMAKESEVITTKLNGGVSSAATSLTVDDTTGMAVGDTIGVVTDSAGIHFSTITAVGSSTALTIADAIDDDASDNDRVYTFTNAFTQKILGVNNAWIRTTDDTDIPIDIISRQEYVDLSKKTESGRVNQLYFDPQVTTANMNVWPVPDDSYTNERIHLYITRPYEDFDGVTNESEPDFPQEWYLPLCWGLAVFVAPKYGVSETRLSELVQIQSILKGQCEAWSSEQESLFLLPADRHGTYRR